MIINYNLSSSRDTMLKNDVGDITGSPPDDSATTKTSRFLGFLLLLCFFLTGSSGWSQVASYAFQSTTATYTAMSGGTVVTTPTTGTVDDGAFLVTLPFSFTFNNVGYTQITVTSNGWVGMGDQASTSTVSNGRAAGNLFTNTVPNNVIAGWFGDNNINSANGGSIKHGLTGTDIYTIEFFQNSGASGGGASATILINYQIILYGPASSSPGRIELTYGPRAGSISTARSIGLNSTGTDYYNAVTGNATTTTTASAFPALNTVYRFTPPAICTGTPIPGTVAPASQMVCTGATPGALTVSGYSTGVTGINFLWEQSTDGGSNWGTATGTGGTTPTFTPASYAGASILYRARVTCSGSGLFDNSTTSVVNPQGIPVTAASALTFGSSLTSVTINWTNGSGGRRYVVVNSANSFTNPVGTGDVTVAGTTYTSGEQIVYDGTGTSVTVSGLTPGNTYYARVYEYNRCTGTPNVNYYNTTTAANNPGSFVGPTNNDVCGNAIGVICGSNTTTFLTGSTNENQPVCGISGVTTQNTPGTWFTFAGTGADVTVSTAASPTNVDTRLAVYSGSCGSLVCLGGNDDRIPGTDLRSDVLVSTAVGTQYYVLLYAFSGTPTAQINLTLTCVAPCTPATTNDTCDTAAGVTVGTPLAANNTCAAPSAVAFPSCGSTFGTYYDSWYSFNSGSNTTVEVSTVAVSPTIVGYAVYSGTCAGTLTQIACNLSGAASNVTVSTGTVYFVRAYSSSPAERGNFTLTVKVPCLVPTAVNASGVTQNSANINWTASASAPANGYEYEVRSSGDAGSGATGLVAQGTTGAGVLTAPISGLATVTTYTIYVRSACGAGDLSPWTSGVTFTTLASCVPPTALTVSNLTAATADLSWTAPTTPTPGVGYEWAVTTSAIPPASGAQIAGTSTSVSGLTGGTTYYLHVRSECIAGTDYSVWATKVFKFLVGDNCGLAIDLGALTSPVNGTTVDATDDYSPSCNSSTAGDIGPDIFYKLNVPPGFTLVIGLTASSYDSVHSVYYGSCGSETSIVCTDTEITNHTWTNNTGIAQTVYWVQDAWFTGSGTYTLAWTLTAPPVIVTSFSPESACSAELEDTDVVLTGSNFTGATDVQLNGVSMPYDINSDTQITVHLTASAATGTITVYNAVTSGTSGSPFTVNLNPTVADITAAGGATNICIPDTLTLSNVTPTGTWSSSDVDVATINTSGVVTPVNVGSVVISYTVTNELTGCTTAKTYALTISEPVEITASTPTQTVVTGGDTSFSVTATGTGNPSLTYQWEVCTDGTGVNFTAVTDDAVYSGSNSATLLLNNVPVEFNGYFYQCTVTGICNSVISDLAVLFVGETGIDVQPLDATICDAGAGSASFTVDASADVTDYQWQEDQGGDNWQDISNGGMYSGTDTATLSLSGVTIANSGWRYKCIVTGIGTAESNPATLTVIQSVAINTDPSAQTVCYSGGSASFNVAATGGIASYQWQYSPDNGANWNNVANGTPAGASYSGAATATLNVTTTAATPAAGPHHYRAVVNASAPCSNLPSAAAQLVINNPTVTGQPSNATVFAGNTANFTVTASTLVAPTYQWQYATAAGGPWANVVNGTPTGVTYTGDTSASLSVVTTSAAAASNARFYRAVVSSGVGCSVNSNAAQLTLNNYCVPAAATSTASFFNLFATTGGVTNINNSSAFSTGGYGNFTAQSASQYQGDPINFNTGLSGTTVGVAIFVDWNSDGDFIDAGEVMANTSTFVSAFSGSFTVPAGATPGAKRMRIYMDFNRGNPSTFPCGPFGSGRGEMEDYTFNVLVKPACSGTPTAGTISASANSVCISGSTVLTATGYQSGVTGITLQWHNSAGPIATATGATYTTPVISAPETYFLRVTCTNGGGFADTNSVTINISNPSVLTTVPGSRCGVGTVNLSGTASAGDTLKWYAASTGGAPLGSGNTFTTPSINTTTNYYVAAESPGGAGVGQVGTATTLTAAIDQPTAFCNRWSQYRAQYVFTAAELLASGLTAGVITSVSFNITTLGDSANNANFIVRMGTTASPTLTTTFVTGLPIVYGPATYTHAVGVNKINFATPFSWDGTSNVIVEVSHSGANATNNAQTYYTATAGNTVVYSTSASPTTGTTSVNRLNIGFEGVLCASARTMVAATVNTPPALTISAASATICSGNSTPLAITSTVANYDSYVWTPSTGVSGSAATGYTFNPTSTTTYTLNASQTSGSLCQNTATFTVTVNPAPPTTNNASICQGGTGSLGATASCSGFINSGTAFNGTWAATPIGNRPDSSADSATCAFSATVTRNYTVTEFQVSVAGAYAFEMNDNAGYDGMAYLVSSAFVPGNCAGGGTFIKGDDDSGVLGDEPRLTATLATGVTYKLISTTWSTSTGTFTGSFAWTVTPPSGGQILIPVNGTIDWYTAASGGSPIGSGASFNPVGVAGSGLADTNTPGTTTFYAACSTNTTCRTAATFTINANVTYYQDTDSDGYGNPAVSQVSCTGAPAGYVALGGDCNDTVAAIHPNAVEVPFNGVDDDCDGSIDETGTVNTTLLASSCGVTLASIGSIVGIQTVGGHPITGYRIRITNGAEVQVLEKTVPHFTITQFPSYAYATTYTVDIQLQRAGIWQASWGATCLVSTPAILEEGGAASVSPSQCGITLPKINTLIATTSLAGVTGYRFRVTNLTDPLGPNAVQTIDRTQNWFSLPMLTRYNYGSLYRIEVAVKTTGAFGGFGSPCEVSSPAVPSLVNCGGTVASGTTTVYATSVEGATQYRFQIVRQADNASTTIDRNSNWFIFNSVPASAFTAGGLYAVRVAVMTKGTWSPFGDACEITAPGAVAKGGNTAGAEASVSDVFKATAYPNPYTADFSLDVITSSKENVQLQVYDMLGKLIETREVKFAELDMTKVGAQYPSGVYNVIVSQEGVVRTLRVIKR